MPPAPSRPPLRGFYAIIDPYPDPSLSFREIAEAYVRAGCPIIQLRMKGLEEHDARKIAQEIRPLIPRDRLFIINDFVEIARDVGAEGVHVGQDDLPPAEAREILGPKAVIGLSTHNLRQARMALGDPVDYIGFGPVFATRSKPNPDPVTGVEALREAVGTVRLPVVALGGITFQSLDSVLAARPAMVCSIAGAIEGGKVESNARLWLERCKRPD
ncbi:MAG: thiamine phosphate synthase [Nitrospirae bacterium]|nr:thiamine phosphate synthase [Nitrospirota bacterium]